MNRGDFKKLTNLRVHEAKILLENECYEGAYYLLGYAVECAFKACIAKQTRRYDFPDKNFATKIYTHEITTLVKYAGLEQTLIKYQEHYETLRNYAIIST